jgi:hypothetical protein
MSSLAAKSASEESSSSVLVAPEYFTQHGTSIDD